MKFVKTFVVLMFLSLIFPAGAFAQTASSSADCSPLDVGCQVCWLFCFPTSWAEDQYNDLKALSNTKAPFAYVNAALNFQTTDTTFAISSLTPITGGWRVNLVNEPSDAAVVNCSVYSASTNRGTSSHLTGDPTPFCEVLYPLDPVHDHIYVTLENGSGDILYTSAIFPDVVGTSGTMSSDVLPLTIVLASTSAVPEVGIPAEASHTFTTSDSGGAIHDFLFTYERPIVTLLLWVLLIAYFWGVAGRIFT